MPSCAVFMRRWDDSRGFGSRRYLGHIHIGQRTEVKAAGRLQARQVWGQRIVRTCDLVEVERDDGRRRWYGTGAGSPGGVGLL